MPASPSPSHGRPVDTEHEALIAEFRRSASSLHGHERDALVEAAGKRGHPELQRELVHLFHTCLWRTTKLRILRALGHRPSERTIEFLMKLAQQPGDLQLAEEALWSLGRSHHALAAHFLRNAYTRSPDLLKPVIAAAIGRGGDRSLLPIFLGDLRSALERRDVRLARSLIVAIAELKGREMLPLVVELLRGTPEPPLVTSLLLAYGKLGREVELLDALEGTLDRHDAEYQLLDIARNQVQFRAQWTLEDYLAKAFGDAPFHPMLPLELHAFDERDVLSGLEVFRERRYVVRMAAVLARLSADDLGRWYGELFPIEDLDANELHAVLASVRSHCHASFLPVLQRVRARVLRERAAPLVSDWMDTVAVADPDATTSFRDLSRSEEYAEFDESLRVSLLNAWVHAMLASADARTKQTGAKALQSLLRDERSRRVRSRILRALAQLEDAGNLGMRVLQLGLGDPELAPSCLHFLAHCPTKQAIPLLEGLIERAADAPLAPLVVKALTAQEEWSGPQSRLDAFLRALVAADRPLDTRRLVLEFLARHPRPALLKEVLHVVTHEPKLHVSAAVALRAYKDERAIEALQALLRSDAPSVVGRALDALTAIPGLRAKIAVLEYVEQHADDNEAVEKVVRCIEPDAAPAPQLAARLDTFLARHTTHPHADGLLRLRDRLHEGAEGPVVVAPEDQRELDAHLTELVPCYPQLDEAAKSALRSAELPFWRPTLFSGRIDKSMAVVQYCKSLDLTIDRFFGRRVLVPQLETKLPALQNVILAIGLDQERPSIERVVKVLRAGRAFPPDALPLHKMTLVANDVLSGRIAHAHWRCLDGLKAWAVCLLLFTRRLAVDGEDGLSEAPLTIAHADDATTARFAARLCALQDMRNPAAHRATVLQLDDLRAVRSEVMSLFADAREMFVA